MAGPSLAGGRIVAGIGEGALAGLKHGEGAIGVFDDFPVVEDIDGPQNDEQHQKEGEHGYGDQLSAQLFDHEISSR